jgi:CRP-like cAMP-binding protein
MEKFIEYVLQFGDLNKQQIDLMTKNGTELTLREGDYFSEAGKIPRQVGFITEGVFRICYYNNKGEEITRHFLGENNLMVDYPNFKANTASSEYLQAVTDCRLIVFSKSNWEEISDTIVGFDQIMDKMYQECLIQKLRKSPEISQDATTRYLEFIETYPSLANRIPLAHIASYIGVTRQSLSRIRKNIR